MARTQVVGDLNGDGIADTVTTGDPSTRLYGSNGDQLDLDSLIDRDGSGKKDPFDKSFFDGISKFLAKHGPAIAKLLLILGSGTATIYNAMKSGAGPTVHNGLMITWILALCGLIVEFGFAYGWSRRGSLDLAGEQVKTNDKVFKRSGYTMVGDLSLSVAEIAFGIGQFATYWIGLVQPIMAVHVIFLFYKLKGEHPEYQAEQEVITLRAQAKAGEVRDKAQQYKLQLADRKNHRKVEWRAMERRHGYMMKLVNGWWFGRRLKREVNTFVGKEHLGTGLKTKLKALPSSLQLKKHQKN